MCRSTALHERTNWVEESVVSSSCADHIAQGKLWRRASESGSSWEVDGAVLHIVITKASDSLGSWPALLQVGRAGLQSSLLHKSRVQDGP